MATLGLYGYYGFDYWDNRRKQAHARVRAKFPDLMEGSAGWHRAVKVQMAKRP